MYKVTNPVSTHTTFDKTLRAKVAATAKRYNVSQAAVFNTAIAEGLRTASFETATTKTVARKAKRTTAKRK